jgi:hypothetical protein
MYSTRANYEYFTPCQLKETKKYLALLFPQFYLLQFIKMSRNSTSKDKRTLRQTRQPRKSKKALKLVIMAIGCGILIASFLFSSQQTPPQPPTLPTPVPVETISPIPSLSLINSKCHINGKLSDKNCTPGTIDSKVTQANIHETICVPGYSAKMRPPVSYTNKLKIQQIKDYGFTDTNLADYEEDHLISLELGGNPTDPKNLWPEPGHSPNQKDIIENRCHRKVCADELSLEEAQKQIATNWETACQ